MAEENEALILPGGGARFAIQAGKLTALSEIGYKPDLIAGVSAGALSGAVYATGQASKFRSICENLSNRKIKKKRYGVPLAVNQFLKRIGVVEAQKARFSNKPLYKLIRKYMLGKFLKIPLEVGVVRVGSDDYFHHKMNTGHQIGEFDCKMILASTAIPGIFEPVVIDGVKYVDGGVRHNAPISPMIKSYDLSHITIISCQPVTNTESKDPDDLLGMIEWGIDEIIESNSNNEYELFNIMNSIAKSGCSLPFWNPKFIRATWFIPEKMGDTLNFSSEQAIKLFDYGYSLKPAS